MRLLRLGPAEVQKLIDEYEKECIEIRTSCLTYAWYMRGGVSYEDVMNMSYTERNILGELIEKNLETTKKSGLPFF
jgi:hypothetical protein